MSYRNKDNIYPEGTILSAKVDPFVKLKVMSYNQRIYYCAVIGDEGRKHLAYFERELLPPQVIPKDSTKSNTLKAI